MLVEYTYKLALFPTKKQADLLEKHFGCVRWVYNHFLDRRLRHYEETKQKNVSRKRLDYHADASELVRLKKQKDTMWLSQVNSQSLQQSLMHLEQAFIGFFEKSSGHPKFKRKGNRNTFRIPQFARLAGSRLYVPKFREGIRIDQHRHVEGEIKNVTIARTPSGKYYAAIQVVRNMKKLQPSDGVVGIDLGVKNIVTTSDGVQIVAPRSFRKHERRIRRLNKAMIRREDGSKGREKSRVKLARAHRKISDIRRDYIHKLTRKIVDENQVIVLEDLNISGLFQNRKLSKSLYDASLSELVRQIKYKAEWYGRQVIQVSRWFPSSKTCSDCHHLNDGIKLSDKFWTCPRCGANHHRDWNAAKNIRDEGMRILRNETTVGTTGIAKRLGVRPVETGI